MNSENFHEYVKNPSMLHQVSYQELKSLVLQYPYSPNLRYLLLLKSLFDQNKEFDRNQVLASLSSPDRKKLRQLVKQYSRMGEIQENYALNEDFLELKDLSVLEDLVEEPNPATAFAPPGNGKAEAIVPPPQPIGSLEDLEDMEAEVEEESDLSFLKGLHFDQEEIAVLGEPEEAPIAEATEETAVESELSGLDDLLEVPIAEAAAEESAVESELSGLDDLLEESVAEATEETAVESELSGLDDLLEVPIAEATEDHVPNEAAPAPDELPMQVQHASHTHDIPLEITNEADLQPLPKPRSSFNAWLKNLTPPQAGLLKTDLKDISLNNRPHPQPEAIVAEDAKQIAEHSVAEDDEIASETFALLLEKQKLYSKAISMYERLNLKYPEKSSLFAAKIEELNKKM